MNLDDIWKYYSNLYKPTKWSIRALRKNLNNMKYKVQRELHLDQLVQFLEPRQKTKEITLFLQKVKILREEVLSDKSSKKILIGDKEVFFEMMSLLKKRGIVILTYKEFGEFIKDNFQLEYTASTIERKLKGN